jgi:hypothetical protein
MDIYIPKRKEVLVAVPAVRHGVGGEFRLVLRNCMGGIAHDTGWFKNLIPDQGLANLTASNAAFSRFYIGSGSTAPANGDTQMQTLLAASTTAQGSDVNTYGVAPNYQRTTLKTKRFAAGVGTGTVREVGCGNNATSIAGLTVRQLVSPAIVKGASQVLDVSYRFTLWPSLADVVGSVTIEGVSYDTITRSLDLDVPSGDTMGQFGFSTASGGYNGVADGNLGSLTASTPLGSVINDVESLTWLSGGQTAGVGYREGDAKFGLNNGNLVGGVRTTWSIFSPLNIKMQCQFNLASDGVGKVLKDGTKEWTPRWRIEWVRH